MAMRTTAGMLAVLLMAATAWADPPQQEQSLDLSAIMSQMTIAGAPGGEDDGDGLPKFEDVTKDMVSSKGMFTLWSYGPAKREQDPEKLLCQIPASLLGQKFMLSTSVSGGGFFTGFPLNENVVQWELRGKQLLLIRPNTDYVINQSKEVADVVSRTYPDTILVAVPLVTKSPSGDPVIDFGGLLKSSFADVGWMTGGFLGMGGGFGGGGINSSLSTWTKKKAFPGNVEIGVDLAINQFSPPGSYSKLGVHYSFWALPETGYQPRVADDRVGYFLTANQDWARPTGSRDLFNRYIDRWQLEKRDPSLDMCEPKQPIVFYIEKTVPVRYRRAVRDGILEWNKAYEKCGFLNAVEVRQQTDDNEWKDLDPEDMRYSFFRWIVTGAGFAMGPHRANPFTGQIYDADIIFDDSMVRFFEMQAQRMVQETALSAKMADPGVAAFLERHPQWQRPTRDWEMVDVGDTVSKEVIAAARERLQGRGHHVCDYIEGMKHQMAFAGAVLAEAPPEVIDDFLYEIIKEVVMHEVGHTLGLRHNFKASSIYTLEQMREKARKGEATLGSVMDYNPPMFFADLDAKQDNFITPTIGPYDYWAIEYGYRPVGSYEAPDDGDGDVADSKSDAPAKPAKAENVAESKSSVTVAGGDIPADLLEKLPPEIRKMMESGDVSAMMQAAGAGGGKSSAPSFASAPSGEEGMLNAIASRCNEPELAYATDEDATGLGPDPTVIRFDAGKDPLDWARTRMTLINKRMENIRDWAVKDQESWYHLRGAFNSLLFERARVLDFVGLYIGGQFYNRNHKGDKGESTPFTLVSAERQREALQFIEEHVCTDNFYTFSPELLNHMAVPRWYHNGATIDITMDYPVHDMIGTLQWYNLFDRLMPYTLRRIHDNEMKTNGSDTFTASEYIQRLAKSVWGETTAGKQLARGSWTDKNPYVSPIRRSLQREYLGLVEPLVRMQPGTVISPDLHAMVRYSLKSLGDDLGKAIESGKADFASQAHLVACKSRIDRMLEPELNEYSPYGSGSAFMHPTGK